MQFTKYTGLGNDFVLLDGAAATDLRNPSALAKTICNRRFGVGADGLVLLSPSDKADIKMRIFNSDGSEAEMCGNASRCVALHLFRRKMVNKKQISLDTLAGIIRTDITDEARGLVRVDMGVPHLTKGEIPMTGNPAKTAVNFPLTTAGQTFYATAVSMGNPHLVIFVPDISRVPLAAWGPQLETHPLFPCKTNVEFVQVLDDKTVRMRVWERGAGITLACGTGSCATAVACILNHKTEKNITVKLDGGDLFIEWPDKKNIFMTGLAQAVFTGDYWGD
ncbi:diaminopimelate epimerase [Candidatus Avelusimicrobium stercoris]|uniref:diaminopimelate epimerase n=1 Tax=Candidatus Avelusimicrobium stercoris TaxID=1947924 RepID=UPI003D0C40EB